LLLLLLRMARECKARQQDEDSGNACANRDETLDEGERAGHVHALWAG